MQIVKKEIKIEGMKSEPTTVVRSIERIIKTRAIFVHKHNRVHLFLFSM